jgi:hypothetical protein
MDRFKYFLEWPLPGNTTGTRQVYPANGSDLPITIEPEGGTCKGYRKKMTADIVLIKDDFTFLYGIYTGATLDASNQVQFYIEKLTNGEYVEQYRGWFGLVDCRFNVSRCHVTFNTQTVDEYTCVKNLLERDINVIDVASWNSIFNDDLTQFETTTVEFFDDYIPDTTLSGGVYTIPIDPSTGAPLWSPPNVQYIDTDYELVTARIIFKRLTPLLQRRFMGVYTYAREFGLTTGGVPSGTGWTFRGQVVVSNQTFNKYTRKPTDGGWPLVFNQVGNVTITSYGNFIRATVSAYRYGYGRLLTAVFDTMLSPCDITFRSDLFTLDNNYVLEALGRTPTTNPLKNITIHAKSDIISPTAALPASIANISLGKLVDMLNAMFQVYWYIDEDGAFRLEHISHFNRVVGLDLIGNNEVKGLHEFEWKIDELPWQERFTMLEAGNRDFVGLPIQYENALVNLRLETSLNAEVTTDIYYIQDNPGDINKSGFVLLVAESSSGEWRVSKEIGILSGDLMANAHLCWANLQDVYWRHDRSTLQATMNGTVQTMETEKKTVTGVPLNIKLCDLRTLNPDELIRTEIGDGELIRATYNMKTETITLELKYDRN